MKQRQNITFIGGVLSGIAGGVSGDAGSILSMYRLGYAVMAVLGMMKKIGLVLLLLAPVLVGTSSCANPPSPEDITINPGILDRIDLDKICIKPPSDLKKPKISKIGNIDASTAKNPNNPIISKFAIVDLKIDDFDKNYPPQIKIFDELTGKELEHIKFKPLVYPCKNPISLTVPVFLAYDKEPWKNPNSEPISRTTRIEVHMPVLNHVDKVYVKLHDTTYGGVFVIPVAWHNMVEHGSSSPVNNHNVIHYFWTSPQITNPLGTIPTDVNTIWGQAGIQFRLVDTSIPFAQGDIPTHLLQPSEKSQVDHNCKVQWKGQFTNKSAVDIYAVSAIIAFGTSKAGWGQCRPQGRIFVEAKSISPQLIAHEFGHYLGNLCEVDIGSSCREQSGLNKGDIGNNLMHSGYSGWELKDTQIKKAREFLKNWIKTQKSYNHQM